MLQEIMNTLTTQRTEDIKMVTQYVSDLSQMPGAANVNKLINEIAENEKDIK
jgi:hypothetical protein